MGYKLTPSQIEEIKKKRAEGLNYFEIASLFNITFQHAQAICTGKRKYHIPSSVLPNERWNPIFSIPDIEASNLGRVRRIQTLRVYTPRKSNNGYLTIGLSYQKKKLTKLIHRLVAEAFLGNCPENYTVNHKDGNKENNNIENLEYVTHAANNLHAYKLHLKDASGENNGRAKLTKEDVLEIKSLALILSVKEIKEIFQISSSHIYAILNGTYWSK